MLTNEVIQAITILKKSLISAGKIQVAQRKTCWYLGASTKRDRDLSLLVLRFHI
jgi:hypothetical protein